MRVACSVDETELENDEGRPVDGVEVTCSRCQHSTESFGTGPASVRRCMALLREECPNGEENFYYAETGEDED